MLHFNWKSYPAKSGDGGEANNFVICVAQTEIELVESVAVHLSHPFDIRERATLVTPNIQPSRRIFSAWAPF